jgi:hypothetical protein
MQVYGHDTSGVIYIDHEKACPMTPIHHISDNAYPPDSLICNGELIVVRPRSNNKVDEETVR